MPLPMTQSQNQEHFDIQVASYHDVLDHECLTLLNLKGPVMISNYVVIKSENKDLYRRYP